MLFLSQTARGLSRINNRLKTADRRRNFVLKTREIIAMCSEINNRKHPMVLNEQDLLQIDEVFIQRLRAQDPDALAGLSIKLANDLKEAMERLNQNPTNSSKPSGSLAPWDKGSTTDDEESESDPEEDSAAEAVAEEDETGKSVSKFDSSEAIQRTRRPGRQTGSPGFGRTQKLTVTAVEQHHCGRCCVCDANLAAVEKAYTGFYSINLKFGNTTSAGVQLTNTHHLYYAGVCPQCGLENRSQPKRVPADTLDWEQVGLTEWRLIGPDLAAMIVYLSMDMRLTRRQVKRFLFDLFGLKLSVGSLQNCLVESARALSPVEGQLAEALLSESLIHADETSHPEAIHRLWLWVFVTSTTALFQIGARSKEIFTNVLDSTTPRFNGWLMSDGYCIYRDYYRRLRCWAHLTRKAIGLTESYHSPSRDSGQQVLEIMNSLMDAIYQAREGPGQGTVSILAEHQDELAHLREICQQMAVCSHKKTRALGREFLNDWVAIFRVLEYPAWPLTNNEAERALRHWVILRKITQGTRSPQGSRALALFASVITTCRLRGHSPLLYIRDVITLRRQGLDAPKIPDTQSPMATV